MPNCEICGEPMPPGEEMFKFHGYSCDCPKPPLPKPEVVTLTLRREDYDALMKAIESAPEPNPKLRELLRR